MHGRGHEVTDPLRPAGSVGVSGAARTEAQGRRKAEWACRHIDSRAAERSGVIDAGSAARLMARQPRPAQPGLSRGRRSCSLSGRLSTPLGHLDRCQTTRPGRDWEYGIMDGRWAEGRSLG